MLMAFCIIHMFLGIAIFVVGGVLTAFGAAMNPRGMSTEAKWFLTKCYFIAFLLIFSSAYLMPIYA